MIPQTQWKDHFFGKWLIPLSLWNYDSTDSVERSLFYDDSTESVERSLFCEGDDSTDSVESTTSFLHLQPFLGCFSDFFLLFGGFNFFGH